MFPGDGSSLLFVTLGDGGSGNDPQNYAQNPLSHLGKILRLLLFLAHNSLARDGAVFASGAPLTGIFCCRLDVDNDDFPADDEKNYAVPFDNPFLGNRDVLDEIWATGLFCCVLAKCS